LSQEPPGQSAVLLQGLAQWVPPKRTSPFLQEVVQGSEGLQRNPPKSSGMEQKSGESQASGAGQRSHVPSGEQRSPPQSEADLQVFAQNVPSFSGPMPAGQGLKHASAAEQRIPGVPPGMRQGVALSQSRTGQVRGADEAGETLEGEVAVPEGKGRRSPPFSAGGQQLTGAERMTPRIQAGNAQERHNDMGAA